MVPPVRWYMLLSTWIFILSTMYPFTRISTYPLNLIAVVGCFEVILNPYNEHMLKNIYILFIHIAPFFWIPYDISARSLFFAALVILVYLAFIWSIEENPLKIYSALLKEKHETVCDFMADRFGIQWQ